MATYRVFCLERRGVTERSDYVAEDDGEALALFTLRGERTDCELWCGSRLVATISRGGLPVQADLLADMAVRHGLRVSARAVTRP